MTDAAAGEFLTIAAAEVAEFPVDILAAACRHVRRTATFPSQIVPMLVEDCERAVALRRFLERRDRPALPAPPEFDRPALPPMTQREVDKLPSYLVTIGLACGALVERKGKVRPAPAAKGARK